MTRLKCWKICPGQRQRCNVVILNPQLTEEEESSKENCFLGFMMICGGCPFHSNACLACLASLAIHFSWGMMISSLVPFERNSGCAPYPTFWRRSPLPEEPLHLSHSWNARTSSHDLQARGAQMAEIIWDSKQELQNGAFS